MWFGIVLGAGLACYAEVGLAPAVCLCLTVHCVGVFYMYYIVFPIFPCHFNSSISISYRLSNIQNIWSNESFVIQNWTKTVLNFLF